MGAAALSVHPRLRGELNIRTADAMAPTGSSPLTRGTPFSHRNICVLQRFIPAYAGNSDAAGTVFYESAVHPRLRGELLCSATISCARRGSSPLTRGTPPEGGKNYLFYRFIPAYAGNSIPSDKSCFLESVHPRLRGELVRLLSASRDLNGSSPLTRGTHVLRRDVVSHTWFIPAYAGNSKELGADTAFHLVHPRLRGELGSSCASREFHSAVHPRLRGELRPRYLNLFNEGGSSPLTRGTLL